MNSSELQNIITKAVIRQTSKMLNDNKKSTKTAPDMTDEELERIVFNGNSYEGIKKKFNLRESTDSFPQITTAEINEFENAMENLVSSMPNATILFDTQENGYFLQITMSPNGVEAIASGNINLTNNGSIKWIFSVQNGLKIIVEEPLTIDQQNKTVISQLYDYFSAWQKDWKGKLNKSAADSQELDNSEAPENAPGDTDNNLNSEFDDANPQVGAGMAPTSV